MTIHVNVAKDPDAVGNVTHNLTLRNLDGTWNYTINNSFKSANDTDMHIYFNTSLVQDGRYRMQVTARADADNETKTHITTNSFIIWSEAGDDVEVDVNIIVWLVLFGLTYVLLYRKGQTMIALIFMTGLAFLLGILLGVNRDIIMWFGMIMLIITVIEGFKRMNS